MFHTATGKDEQSIIGLEHYIVHGVFLNMRRLHAGFGGIMLLGRCCLLNLHREVGNIPWSAHLYLFIMIRSAAHQSSNIKILGRQIVAVGYSFGTFEVCL